MQERSSRTHVHLMETANQLFSRNGYDATGVAEICQAAGVSKGAFYHHFPSKQALFVAILEQWMEGLQTAFSQMRQQTTSVPDAILQMAELSGQVFQSSDVHLSILLEFWTQAQRDEQIWQATLEPYRHYEMYFANLIQEGIDGGYFEPVDVGLASRSLVGMALGLLMQALFEPQARDWSQEVRQRTALFLQCMLRRSE